MFNYEKCYELSGTSIPGDTTFGGRYRITLLPMRGTTTYLLDELMNDPDYNRTMIIDESSYPDTDLAEIHPLCLGFITETVIFRNDDYTESIRVVTAANNVRKSYLMVRFSNPGAYYNFQDPESVKWATLASSPAQPVSYSEKAVEFALANLHPLFETGD